MDFYVTRYINGTAVSPEQLKELNVSNQKIKSICTSLRARVRKETSEDKRKDQGEGESGSSWQYS